MSVYHRIQNKKRMGQTALIDYTPQIVTPQNTLPVSDVPENYSICLGLNNAEKQAVIKKYVKNHDVKKVVIFFPRKFPLPLQINNVPIDNCEYMDMFQFKYYYRLLEQIDHNTLIVFNECMRNQDRKVITYSAAHDFARNTPHILVFEYFPIIEQPKDFMVQLEFIDPARYKNKPFTYDYLKENRVWMRPTDISVYTKNMILTQKDRELYSAKKQKLFETLDENKDPDVIPRELHLFVGNLKKRMLQSNNVYVARTKRFGNYNNCVYTYRGDLNPKISSYKVIDFPCRRLEFNDFLKATGMTTICFLNSGLKVDQYYLQDFKKWINNLTEFYSNAKANIH